jgi:hypothetical protein
MSKFARFIFTTLEGIDWESSPEKTAAIAAEPFGRRTTRYEKDGLWFEVSERMQEAGVQVSITVRDYAGGTYSARSAGREWNTTAYRSKDLPNMRVFDLFNYANYAINIEQYALRHTFRATAPRRVCVCCRLLESDKPRGIGPAHNRTKKHLANAAAYEQRVVIRQFKRQLGVRLNGDVARAIMEWF